MINAIRMVFDALRMAGISITAAKARSFLTMLGVVIGVFAVSSLVAVGQGVRKQSEEIIIGLGPDVLVVVPGATPGGGTPSPTSQFGTSTLTLDDFEAIQKLPSIREAQAAMFVSLLVSHEETKTAPFTLGVTPGIERFFKLELESGRTIEQEDLDGKVRVAAFGSVAAEKLGLSDRKLDEVVKIGKEEFQVVGYFKKTSQVFFGFNIDDLVAVPVTSAQELVDSDRIHRVWAFSRDPRHLEPARREIYDTLLARHGEEDFTILEQSDILKTLNQFLNIMTALVTGLAGISLLVGGIGIMNIMLVAVTERTREIGLRKAVGATTTHILIQFLIEAAVLSLLGAAIGMGLTSVAIKIASAKTPLHPYLTWQSVALATGVGIVVGVVFGLLPAIRAARKNPIEALRYE